MPFSRYLQILEAISFENGQKKQADLHREGAEEIQDAYILVVYLMGTKYVFPLILPILSMKTCYFFSQKIWRIKK